MSSPRRILEGSNATQTIKHSIFDVVRLRHFLKSCTRVFIRLKAFSSMSVLGRWWWCIVGCNESLQFKNIVVCLFPPPLFSCRTVNLRWNSFRSQSSESTLNLPSIHFGGTKVDRHSIESFSCFLRTSSSDRIENRALPKSDECWRSSILFGDIGVPSYSRFVASLVDPLLLPLEFLSSFRFLARKFSNLHHRSTRNLSGGFEWGPFFPGVLAFAFASGEGQKSLTQRVRVLVEFRSRAQ